MKNGYYWYFLVAFFCAALPSAAQIRVGQTAGFTGPVRATVKEATAGAMLYIDSVNAKGGINGQTIELISLDDQFEPDQAAANARKLIEEHKVVALFLTRGTPHNLAILPLLEQHGVPLVGPSTGAMVLHEPVQKYVFNVRSPYQREAEKGVAQLLPMGYSRVGLLYVDGSFGTDGLVGALKGFEAAILVPVFQEKFDRKKPEFGDVVARAAPTFPQTILIIGSGKAVVDGIAAFRDACVQAQFATLSNNASSGFIKLLGANAQGLIVTQVFPSQRASSYPLVAQAQALSNAKGTGEISPAVLEGFASAKVLVKAFPYKATYH